MTYTFWEVIEKAKLDAGDEWARRPQVLASILKTFSTEKIREFRHDYRSKLGESYRWDLCAAAFVINRDCDFECFECFRDYIISEGQETFEMVMSNPDNLADIEKLQNIKFPEYRFAVYEAYEAVTGDDWRLDIAQFPSLPENLHGKEWESSDLSELLPRLVARYDFSASDSDSCDCVDTSK